MKTAQIVVHHYEDGSPLRVNIDGTAGTGKSFLIAALSQGLASCAPLNASPQLLRLGPTGVVAFQISGETYHSTLSIFPRTTFAPLEGSSLQRLQARLKSIRYLIIDEKSMIGLRSLAKIDSRLRQAFPSRNDEFFGGVSILLFGDFAQLPPVGDYPMFMMPKEGDSLAMNGRLVYLSFCHSITLTQIMRQVGESEEQIRFRDLLMRLRDSCCTMEDWKTLQTRFQVDMNGRPRLSEIEIARFNDAIRIFPHRASVAMYNQECMRKSGVLVKRLMARHPNGGRRAQNAMDDDAGGLTSMLYLSKGSKVMLTQNLWTQKGLVNGSTGTVEDIVWLDPQDVNNLPAISFLAMPRYKGPTLWRTHENVPIVPIPPSLASWEKDIDGIHMHLSRQQFPLCLANAITVHKSQGATIEVVVLDISGSEFAIGLAFVAISRMKRLDGLLFEKDFNHVRICPPRQNRVLLVRKEDDIRRSKLQIV